MRVLILALLSIPLAAQVDARRVFYPADSETSPSSLPPEQIADSWFSGHTAEIGLAKEDAAGVFLAHRFTTAHNGVRHLRYRQRFHGIEVYNADWVMNIASDGRILNAGGILFVRPAAGVLPPSLTGAYAATRAAAIAVNPEAGAKLLPTVRSIKGSKQATFERGAFADDFIAEPAWYGWRGKLLPVLLVDVADPNQIEYWRVIVDAATNHVIHKEAQTLYQRPPRGLVFDRTSPQPNPNPGTRLDAPPPIVERVLVPFTGDPVASPLGWVQNNTSMGNNSVVGVNPLGIPLLLTPRLVTARDGDFSFPLELGLGAPSPLAFPEASAANLFYWVNRSHDLFHAAGFDEPAGNFQQDNVNRGGTGGDPMYAYTHFGHAQGILGATRNAFYTTRRNEDGQPSGIHMFLSLPFSGPAEFFADGSYDNEVIVHEYTHGVTLRLVRQLSSTFQGGAMGEAMSDFFGMEFTIPGGAPPEGVYPAGEYFTQNFGLGLRAFPYTTNMEVNPIHYDRLGSVTIVPAIHDDGGIWFMALWEMRANLIAQFGEREGRRRTRLLVIDGLKLSPPAPSMIDVRDAILLADRSGFQGASQRQIWAAFAKRGLGALAQTIGGAQTYHVAGSFELPSPQGQLAFFEKQYTIGEEVRVVLHDANLTTPLVTIRLTSTSGDIENLELRRSGSSWYGRMFTTAAATANFSGLLSVSPGDHIEAHYIDYNTGSGEAKLIQVSSTTEPAHFQQTLAAAPLTFPNETRMNFRAQNATRLNYPLPFSFPFFGKRYNFARVSTSGLISFEPFLPGLCSDINVFANVRGVAPLWIPARTNGTMQPDEDIYVSASGDAITFRWVSETVPPNALTAPEPLNFAVTLRADGTIEYRYGSGNRNLASSFPTLCGPSPLVGVSNGYQSWWNTAVHAGRVNLENAQMVRFLSPAAPTTLPIVRVDTDVEGQTFQGVMIVQGISSDPTTGAAARVDALIDGVLVARAGTGVPRPDACMREPLAGCPGIGFTLALDLNAGGIAPGRHSLQFKATSARGAATIFPEQPYRFAVQAGDGPSPVGAITAPANDAGVTGTVNVEGWVYLPGVAIVAVDVLADNVTVGRATYSMPNAAACAGLTNVPNCPNVGFRLVWNTRNPAIPTINGVRNLALRVQDQTGRVLLTRPLATVNVDNPVPQVPRGVLESIRNNEVLSGVVRVSGYAYDPDGRIAGIAVVLNGISTGSTRVGIARPEICAELSGVAACPNIGFESMLDTRLHPNGEYTLGVLLFDDAGNTTIIPRVAANGLNIRIRN